MSIKLEQLTFYNAFTYRKCVIPLLDQGLVYLRGENGHGKSVPWEVLQHTGYGTTSRGLKKGGIVCTVPRDNPDEERGFLSELIVSNDAGKYAGRWLIRQSRDHGKYDTAVRIYREIGGEWKDRWPGGGCPKKMDDAQTLAGEIIGLSQNEFEGCLYLSQSGTHTLIEGKPSEKMMYLAYLFGVDRYDKVLRVLKDKLSEVDKDLLGTVNLEGQLGTLRQQLGSMKSSEAIAAEISELRELETVCATNLKKWRDKRDAARDAVKVVEQRESLQAELSAFADIDMSGYEKLKEEIGQLSSRYDKLRDTIKAAQRYDGLKAHLDSLLEGLDPKEHVNIDSSLTEMRDRRTEVKALIEPVKRRIWLEEQLAKCAPLEDDVSGLQDQITLVEKNLAVQREKYRSGMAEYKELEAQVAEFKTGVCPTCKRPMNIDEMKTRIESLADDLNKLHTDMQKPKDNLAKLKTQMEEAKSTTELQAGIDKLPKGDPEKLTEEHDTLRARIDKLSAIQTRLYEAKTLQSQLAEMDGSYDLDAGQAELAKVEVKLSKLRARLEKTNQALALQRQLEKLPEVERAKVEKDLLIANDAYTEVDTETAEIKKKLLISETEDTNRKRLEAELTEVEDKVYELEAVRTKQKTLQYAVAAVPKLKKRKLHKIVCAVRDVLPRYAGTMFSHEPNTSFLVEEDDESVDFVARRMVPVHGTLEPVMVPVKGFSGGEKQRLSVAFIFTLHSLLNPAKKPDVLVLDEVDKGLDAKGIASLMALVEEVKNQYGTVVMTSHREQISGATFDKIWVVEKKYEESHLKMLQ